MLKHSAIALDTSAGMLAAISQHATDLNDRDKAFTAYAQPVIAFTHASVIDGDPTKDIATIEKMPLVFKNGVGYDTAKIFAAMNELVGLH